MNFALIKSLHTHAMFREVKCLRYVIDTTGRALNQDAYLT